MKPKDLPLFRNREAKRVLEQSCTENGVNLSLLQNLLDIQRKYSGSGRAVGITADFEAAIADFLEESEPSQPVLPGAA